MNVNVFETEQISVKFSLNLHKVREPHRCCLQY